MPLLQWRDQRSRLYDNNILRDISKFSMTINHERLLTRFLRYVQIDTTAGDSTETYPSSPGQLELGRMLAQELRALGLGDAAQDQHGIVMATVPATTDRDVPVVAL